MSLLLLFQQLLTPAASTPTPTPTPAVQTAPLTFGQKLASLLPQSWFSTSAMTATPGNQSTNGITASVMNGLGAGHQIISNQQAYAKQQTRLMTATDVNVDAAAVDFFGLTMTRYPGESDRAYANRIVARLLWPQPTLAGIQNAVNAWLFGVQFLPKQFPMGADTFGGLDTFGSLDDQLPNQSGGQTYIGLDTSGALDTTGGMDTASVNFNAPTVYVFDLQSDPVTSALISPNIAPPQFCIFFNYPGYAVNLIHPINSYDSNLTAIVNAVKAEGCVPVFASNYK